jgi:transposase InsO family protein
MTFLPARIQGRWFYLYLILDLYSRKVVGFEVHDTDNPEHAAHLPGERRSPRACMPSRCDRCCTATTAQP